MATTPVREDWTRWNGTRLRMEASHAERSRQPDRAIALLQEAVRRSPYDWKSVRHLGSLLARLGRKRPAKEHFRRLAEHFEREGISARAIAVWKIVLSFEPEFPGSHVKLGELYAAEGLRADARKHYREALARYRATGRDREADQIEARITELDELSHPRLRVPSTDAPPAPSDAAANPPSDTGGAATAALTAGGGPEAGAEEEEGTKLAREIQRLVEDQVGRDDYEMRYDLGITYRGLGLLDEAIAELQLASRGVHRLVECARMLAVCFVEKGQAHLAVKWLERGLAEPGLDPRLAMDLRYEIAGALEADEEDERAFGLYVELYGEDPGFRDVAEKLRQLGEARGLGAGSPWGASAVTAESLT
jgi:tetratricopeptide (TPR) repeat protein